MKLKMIAQIKTLLMVVYIEIEKIEQLEKLEMQARATVVKKRKPPHIYLQVIQGGKSD